jgi:ligand-binding sensor domain-containing protein
MLKIYSGIILLLLFLPGTHCRQIPKEPAAPDGQGIRAEDLSNRHVICFGEDREGYLWIGTARGLNKYNGYGHLHYLHPDKDSASLSNNYVQNIFTASQGDLWVTTRSGISRTAKYGCAWATDSRCWTPKSCSLSCRRRPCAAIRRCRRPLFR